jgi:hypothetical protein
VSTPVDLTGVVDVRVTGVGSKSEMTSVVLLPDGAASQPLLLRRREAAALDAEAELTAYAGQRVRVTGSRGLASLLVDRIEPVH